MFAVLAHLCADAGRRVAVSKALFEGDPAFVTALALRCERGDVVFRAQAADDTLTATASELHPEADEVVVAAGGSPPWSECLGREIVWGWPLTNQNGYTDGVRLEFTGPSRTVIEFVVAASCIRVFVAVAAEE